MDDQELLDRFRRSPALVRAALTGLPAGALRRPGPEGWSVADVILHMSDAELVRAARVRLILAEDGPELFDFDQERWREGLAYGGRDPRRALALYEAAVGGTADLLAAAGAGCWVRAGRHPKDGLLTVRTLIERGAAHGREHAVQVRQLAADAAP